MGTNFRRSFAKFFGVELDFRVRMFNLLAMVGAFISLLMAVSSLVINIDLVSAAFNVLMSALSVSLFYYSYKSGQYRRCYLLTIFLIFFLGFAFLFIMGGAYHSGFPAFFIFAIVFTVFMLEGWRMVAVALAELIFYIVLCLYAYYWPDRIVWLDKEVDIVTDVVVAFVSVSCVLGITMYFSFHMYNRQQQLLEEARAEAVRASQAKSSFLASMSHEIRTPINIMLGMTEMISRECPTGNTADYVQRSQAAGQMLLALVDDILDVAKIESGKIEFLEEPYFTEDLVQRLTLLGRELAAVKGLTFAVDAVNLPPVLCGDILHLRQIAANFLSNAAKYTRSGAVNLTISATELPDGTGVLLSLAVTDTGVGIQEEDLDKIFAAFTRGEAARRHKIEGTGLGLAIAKDLATLMGGKLLVNSSYGKGSTFTAEIPQRYAGDSAETLQRAFDSLTERSFVAPQGRVLVVDDNEGNLDVVKSLLERTQLQVDTALTGRQCLELARRSQYHVILLDYMMPDMDGLITLQQLRQFVDDDTPVIALTANVTAGTRQKLLDAGFADYISKPILYTRLEQALVACLPSELVTYTRLNTIETVTQALALDEQQLKPYDISLATGLKFVNGDLGQYKHIAEIFLTHTRYTAKALPQFAATGDVTALFHYSHSLKTLAQNIGARGLSELARQVEEQCSAENLPYVCAALPLLLYEIERTCCGLEQLIAQDIEVASELSSDCVRHWESVFKQTEASIADCSCTSSRQGLLNLLAIEQNLEQRQLLKQVLAAVDNLNFEEAAVLFQQFSSSVKGG